MVRYTSGAARPLGTVDTVRLFVALWPPRDALDALAAALARSPAAEVRWIPPERWHITVRFLGDVGDATLPDLRAALSAVAAAGAPAPIDVGPATERLGPGLIAVPVAGVDALAAAVIGATAGIGQPPEERPFRGHITLARARRGRRVPGRLVGEPLAAAWLATTLELVSSRSGADGLRYETVTSWDLGLPSGA